MLGSKQNYHARRSLCVSAMVKNGVILTEKNIKSVRPSFGLDLKYYNQILGKKVTKGLEIGERLTWDSIE